jgi:8-oxo-dGTP diphosphatase
VPLYIVRHAKAESRSAWTDDDAVRPLTAEGVAQAEAIAEVLAPAAAGPLLSSPYLRCLQTLAPLADRLGLSVLPDERLSEGAPFEPALDLLGDVPDGAVLCSHGDVIPSVLGLLERDGMTLNSWCDTRKSATAILDRVGKSFVTASFWAPPA